MIIVKRNVVSVYSTNNVGSETKVTADHNRFIYSGTGI